MPTTANIIDISALPPAARSEVRDFYQFLLMRSKKSVKLPDTTDHGQWFCNTAGRFLVDANQIPVA